MALELGCGCSPLIALALAPKIARFVATDQQYILKIFDQNVRENSPRTPHQPKRHRGPGQIETLVLDWQLNDPSNLFEALENSEPSGKGASGKGVDCIFACDCMFNEGLVEPLVETCRSICMTRAGAHDALQPTLCILAQQIRSADVLEYWLSVMMRYFLVYRIRGQMLPAELSETSGLVIHLAILNQ